MDIISQLQEQVSTIAALAVNTYGSLQRDAPPVRLSPNYPEPPPPTTVPAEDANFSDQPKLMSQALVDAAKKAIQGSADLLAQLYNLFVEMLSFVLHFDALVTALPLSEGGEEAQLRRIAELQAENDTVGQELQKQLEAAENELKQVQELFSKAADSSLNLKKPD